MRSLFSCLCDSWHKFIKAEKNKIVATNNNVCCASNYSDNFYGNTVKMILPLEGMRNGNAENALSQAIQPIANAPADFFVRRTQNELK